MSDTDPPTSSSPVSSLDLDRDAFRDHARAEHASEGADRPVVVRTVATLDVETTPLTAYAALTGRVDGSDRERSSYAFLLESAEKTASSDPDGAFRPSSAEPDRHARYSYVGYDPEAVVTVQSGEASVETLTEDAVLAEVDTIADGDTVDALRAAMPDARLANFPDHDRQHLEGGLVGFLAYDAVYDLWLEEVGLDRPDSRFPDAQFVLTTKTLAFDERDGTVSLVFTPILEDGDDPDAVYDAIQTETAAVVETLREAERPETDGFVKENERAGPKADYEDSVREAKEHVLDGDIYQGVISRKRELYGEVDPMGFYEAMREINPSPYMYLLDHDDLTVVGASPETLISVRGREVMSNPIAGTCDRGSSPVEDRRLAGEMLADEKERAEHTMLVDLARNDVRRVSEAGSVRVDEFMNVLKYSHVQHIESTVTGELANDTDVAEPRSAARETRSPDAFDATRASFPAGTLSGAPKIRAMEIIDDLEAQPRGLYGGGVGYYSWTGDADFAIVIRTATVEKGAAPRRGNSESSRPLDDDVFQDAADERAGDPRAEGDLDRITVQAGAGLVADSDPESEYEETEKKMGGVLAALEEIEVPRDGTDSSREPTPEVRQ